MTISGKLFRAPAPILVGIALVLYAGLVRWPYRGVIAEDESFFLIVGHQWLLGLPPYVGAFDVKPPGLFAVVALAESLLGPTFAAIKALEAVAVGATSVALWTFGRRYLSPRVGLVAGLLYPPASLALSGVSSPPELVTSAFVAVAVLIGWDAAQADAPRPLGWLAVGLLMGAAMSVKQTAAFETVAFGLALLTRPGGMRLTPVAACILGCAAIPLGFAAFYAAGGHFNALLDDAVLGALGRVKGDGLTWAEAVRRTPAMLKPIVLLVGAAALAWAERRRLRGTPLWPATRLLTFWLAGALAGILVVKSMYDHYFLTLLPPLCLLAALGLAMLPIPAPRLRLAAQATLVVATAAFLVSRPVALVGPAAGQLAAERQAAADLRGLGQRPGDRILVLGWDLGVYLLAGAEPAAPIFHQQHLLCAFPKLDGADPLAAAFAAQPAFVILPGADIHLICELDGRRQEVSALLGRDYCALARSDRFTVQGLPSELTIYGRRAQFAADCARRAPALNIAGTAPARPGASAAR